MNYGYPTDLTDAEWALLQPLLPAAKRGGRPRDVELRAVLNAILCVLGQAWSWRRLPLDFPPWETVYWYFRAWTDDGTWQQVQIVLWAGVQRGTVREATLQAAQGAVGRLRGKAA